MAELHPGNHHRRDHRARGRARSGARHLGGALGGGGTRDGGLMPSGLRVIDSHVHFWDPSVLRYPWLEGASILSAPFLPSDYSPLRSGDVDAVVFVEANP